MVQFWGTEVNDNGVRDLVAELSLKKVAYFDRVMREIILSLFFLHVWTIINKRDGRIQKDGCSV